jgi:DNA-binding NarL/FixJ family response regulator
MRNLNIAPGRRRHRIIDSVFKIAASVLTMLWSEACKRDYASNRHMNSLRAVKINILLADDHPIALEGLRAVIQSQQDMAVVGAAQTGREAVLLAQKLHPDIVVLDLLMPELDGIKASDQIRKHNPATMILILSSSSNAQNVRRALDAGANGYITKHTAPTDLFRAIHRVRNGEVFLSAAVSGSVAQPAPMAASDRWARLTEREKEVLQLIAQGCANKIIADRLNISIKTVEKHRQQLMNKTNIHEVAGLTRYAIEVGLTTLDQSDTTTAL